MAAHDAPLEELSRRFRSLAEVDCRGYSPLYERLSLAIADDVELLELLARARPGQRRPTLLLAAVNYLGGMSEFETFREFALDHRDDVLEVVETRATQTNEVGRCAVLLPAFLRAPEPLAIVEVGASAGLNLLLDRYGYDYGTARIGDGSPCLECQSYVVPDHVPEVEWRIGLDREPVDVREPMRSHGCAPACGPIRPIASRSSTPQSRWPDASRRPSCGATPSAISKR